MIAADAALGVELVQRLGQPRERGFIIEVALHEPASLGQPIPDRLTERGAGVLFDELVDPLAKASSSQSRRANPTRAKVGGSKPRLARS